MNATVEVAPTATTNCECKQEWCESHDSSHKISESVSHITETVSSRGLNQRSALRGLLLLRPSPQLAASPPGSASCCRGGL